MKTFCTLVAAIICLFANAQVIAENLGGAAPALNVSEFIKGDAVDVTDGGIYVVEFWATWCPPCRASIPHLTELQKKFKDKGVTFIGISQEDLAAVKPFVESMGDAMQYTVAVDNNGATTESYLAPFGIQGIPHAFIVKEGKLVWHGHPMDSLEEMLDAIALQE
ncbi:MAG: TlpA family protein disulfide reductase [bacterium]|nr:TlpA family protein disulfide reductase [bacterium]